MASAPHPHLALIRFGVFELDPATGELRKAGRRVRLRPQPARVLMILASRRGQVVSREELRNEIWGSDTFVDFEHGVNLCIRQIREALNDDADAPRYIETIPRRGYRFIAQTEEYMAGLADAVPARGSDGAAARPPLSQDDTASPHIAITWRRGALILAWAAVALGMVAVPLVSTPLRHLLLRNQPPPLHVGSIAVLPLENLSRDPDQEYFADGMTDELITDLAKIHTLRVISRNSVMQYKGKHEPVPQIGRELNVDAVVEGTVTRFGDRVRITAQLIAAREDRHLWADSYEGDLRNILALQDDVTTAIAKQISIQLTPQEQTQFRRARAVDPVGHQFYLRGLYELRNHTVESNAKAIEHFQRAIAVDPQDALAYEGLAVAYILSPDEAPKSVMPKAKAAALKAIELDDSLAEAHSSLGFVKLVFDWDWAAAEQELKKALELNPNSPRAHTDYARYLLLVPHRADEAIRNVHRAYELDPAVPEEDDLVALFFFSRQYQAGIDEAAKELDDDSPFLALANAEVGQREKALAVADRAAASAKVPTQMAQTASAYALAGDKKRAYALLARIIQQANQRYICGMNMAAVYSVLGDKDEAMAWLEKGYRDRST